MQSTQELMKHLHVEQGLKARSFGPRGTGVCIQCTREVPHEITLAALNKCKCPE